MSKNRLLVVMFLLTVPFLARCSGPEVEKRELVRDGDALIQQKRYPEAIIRYRKAIQIDPKLAEVRMKLADAYVQTNDVKNALREYIRAADLLPDSVEAQLKAGGALLWGRQFDDAKVRANKILAKHPNNVEALILKANASAGLRKLDDAIAEVQEAIRNDPERSASYASLSAMQVMAGNREEAEAAFRKTVETAPKSVPARLALGAFYWMTGRLSDAERQMKAALELDPKSLLANRALAYYYVGTRQPRKAEPHFVSAAEAAPDTSGKLDLADFYISQDRRDDARRLLEGLSQNDKDVQAYSASRLRLAGLGMGSDGPEAALKQLDEILAKQPNNPDALIAKAEALTHLGKLDEASTAIQAAAKANPESPSVQFALGKMYGYRHQTNEAITAFNEALKLNPTMATAEVELAKLHLAAGRLDQAEQFAQGAVGKVAGYVDAQLLLARINLMSGNISRAEPRIRMLVKFLADLPAVQAELGQLELFKGNRQAARAAFQRSIAKNPMQLDAVGGLIGMDIEEKKLDEARARTAALVARAPKSPTILVLASGIYKAMGDLAEAERFAHQAVEADPNTLEAYFLLGRIYFAQGRLDDAIAKYSKLAEKQNTAGVQTVLGVLLEMQNKHAEARAKYERALQIDPHAAVAANNLAMIHLNNGDLEMAAQLAQTAKAGLPDQPAINDTLGWVYVKKGLASLAIAPLRQSVEKQPKNAAYHYHLGVAYADAGDKVNARASLQKALQLDPNFNGAAAAKEALAKLKG